MKHMIVNIKIRLLLILFVFLYGCGPQLNTLIQLSREQEEQHQYVNVQRKKFQALVNHIEREKLKIGLSSEKIMANYGEPVVISEEEGRKRYAYRDPVEFNPTKKVYLYFDKDDKLADFKVLVNEPQENPASD